MSTSNSAASDHHELAPIGYSSDTGIPQKTTMHSALPRFTHSSSTYASSIENISGLLEGWMRSSPKPTTVKLERQQEPSIAFANNNCSSSSNAHIPHEVLESLLSFENLGCIGWDKSSSDSSVCHGPQSAITDTDGAKQRSDSHQPPMSVLEKWLLDEATGQVECPMEMSDAII